MQRVAELIDRLNNTPVQNRFIASQKNEAFSRAVTANVFGTGVSYGEASGLLPFLNGPQDEVFRYIRSIDNDLSEQIRIFDGILDGWFTHGEAVAPHYPFRIAVILRKMKRRDLESHFLRAYGRHFISHYYGATSRDMALRIEKLIGSEEAECLWEMSEAGDMPDSLRGTVRKLGIFPERYPDPQSRSDDLKAHYRFLCKRCGSHDLALPINERENASCPSCGIAFGSLASIQCACAWLKDKA